MAVIGILEDETDLREELGIFLTNKGHRVIGAGSIGEFEDLLPEIDIALIDVMLPDGESFDLVNRLNREYPEKGIIMLTARGLSEDVLQGLNFGADHYLIKPVKLIELAAIVESVLRRVKLGWRFDQAAGVLVDPNGRRFILASAEAHLFQLFTDNAQPIVSRRSLVESMGHEWSSFDLRRLDTMISRLRQRFRDETGSELPMRTERNLGYCFNVPINKI